MEMPQKIDKQLSLADIRNLFKKWRDDNPATKCGRVPLHLVEVLRQSQSRFSADQLAEASGVRLESIHRILIHPSSPPPDPPSISNPSFAEILLGGKTAPSKMEARISSVRGLELSLSGLDRNGLVQLVQTFTALALGGEE